MPKLALAPYGDFDSRKFTDAQGNSLSLPTLTLGDTLVIQQRFLTHEGDGVRERKVQVRAIKASIGLTMAPPESGGFSLHFATNAAVGPFTVDTTAAELLAALHTAFGDARLPYDCVAAEQAVGKTADGTLSNVPCCWLVRFAHDDAVTLTVMPDSNTLAPESFVRCRAVQMRGNWWVEIRLIQAPYAFNSGHTVVLPPAPAMQDGTNGTPNKRTAGEAASPGASGVNELQVLKVPASFQGTYALTWNYRRTSPLASGAGTDEIAAKLNALYTDGLTRFAVTDPEYEHAYIEFVGPLAKAPQSLITAPVNSFEPGVVTFEVPLDRAEMETALRAVPRIVLDPSAAVPGGLEVEVQYVEDDEDIDDEGIPSKKITFKQLVVVEREQIYAELAEAQAIDFLHSPAPTSYIPPGLNNVITGTQSYRATRGDGATLSFSLVHDLGTSDLQAPAVWERATGRLMVNGGDYQVVLPTEDSVPSVNEAMIYFAVAPPTNGARIVLTSAGPNSAFIDGLTVTIGQVTGLGAYIDATAETLGTIEDQIAFATPAVLTDDSATVQTFNLAPRSMIFPGRFGGLLPTGMDEFVTPKLPDRIGILLPALHVSAPIEADLTTPISLADAKGKVYKHSGTADVTLPGGRGHKSPTIKQNDYVGCDGRVWYTVREEPGKKSWYPIAMERLLFLLPVNDRMLRLGQSLQIARQLDMQLLGANTTMQWLLVVEVGTVGSDASPSPTGVNEADITWSSTPILSQQIILADESVSCKFGAVIRRSLSNAMTADRILYGANEAANAGAPATANFVLRGMLREADTENGVANAVGAAWSRVAEGSWTIG